MIHDNLPKSPLEVKNSPYEREKLFLQELKEIIMVNLIDTGLNGDFIGHKMGISRMHLYRKLKALTNQSVSEVIKGLRLKKAHELLELGKHSSSETGYKTGFNSPAHFSTSFKKKFGYSPSVLIKKKQKTQFNDNHAKIPPNPNFIPAKKTIKAAAKRGAIMEITRK